MKYQNSFQRLEKKYLINEKQYRSLMTLIYMRLEYDKYQKYKICNIYFDTPDYDLIRESIDKPIYKEKLRIRSYGTPTEDDMVFIEMKKKFDGIVYKRRAVLSYKQAINYCLNGNMPMDKNQVINEIDWLMRRYDLRPALYLSYDRLAMKGVGDSELRITFDRNLKWRTNQLDLSLGDFGEARLPSDHYIMEIKAAGAFPLWLAEALNSLSIYPKSYSKYGIIYKENLLQQ